MVGVSSSPAFASNQNTNIVVNNKQVGGLLFLDDGDDWELWDYYSDGHGVRAYIEVGVAGGWALWTDGTWYNGKGASTVAKKTDGNLYTGISYRARACTVDGASDTTPVNCSSWMYIQE
ncbi:hypothetical protein [Streptomyces sp. cg35]|uniref:hypothetical protein n=1 Tax=Streptomyces sp. cg35 TaxID=3421650 RepID=UPI003D168AB4